jgi:DNA polymerase-3 subunit epsilon
MLVDAPVFADVSTQLLDLLDGAVLVAHNVRFDHGFLKNEFARVGHDLRLKTLCTVRLSRRLYPQHRSHGLDALMQRHALSNQARHRAMGDVLVVCDWLALMEQEHGNVALAAAVQALLVGLASTPPLLQTPLDSIPRGPGVYLMYGAGPLPLYIGKSVTLRDRVKSHFQTAHLTGKAMQLSLEVQRVEWVETVGEVGALLLESRLIKQKQPVHNRHLRRQSVLCAWHLDANCSAKPLLTLVESDNLTAVAASTLYGPYRSRALAHETLRALVELHQLCPQMVGLTSGKGRCFAHQIARCRGVCCGDESVQAHHARVLAALASQQLPQWPFPGAVGLREYDARTERSEMHVFDQWCHVGSASDEAQLEQLLSARRALLLDLDVLQMLKKQVRSGLAANWLAF